MNEQRLALADSESDATRVERFQALSSGQYWRSNEKVASQGIENDEMLLITSIRWVDDKPHTIILRPHPNNMGHSYCVEVKENGHTYRQWHSYSEHRFLLDDFLKVFEFEPDHERVRSKELKQVQQKIADLQTELIEVQGDPTLMQLIIDQGLRDAEAKTAADQPKTKGKQLPALVTYSQAAASLATGTVANAIGSGITEAGIEQMKAAANRQHQIATVQAKWIQGKTEAIAETITAMTPFFQEKAAAALAHTEETRSYVSKLMQGIESLDLYVGKGVEVSTIRSGTSAPLEEPLTFMQRKLLMDEELALWADIDEKFDFRKESAFFDALRSHPDLVNQIFPTPRCALVMAVTRRDIDYGDKWLNDGRNRENRKVFILVRDGENLHRIFSPVESHLGTSRLFPSEDDQKQIFRGFNGSQIKFDDVAFTDRLAQHELHALHYKRFLLLCCGLDHRMKLFGEFYPGPPTLDFVSMKFQEEYCRFLHDDPDSGRLIGDTRQKVAGWIKEKNTYLRSGSRVLCNWHELLNPSTAPAACREGRAHRRDYRLQYEPKNRHDVRIAYRDGQSLCVDIEVHGESYREDKRSFKSKVNLTKFKDGNWDYTDQPFLCLDAVSAEELHYYIHHRESRRDHLDYIRFFKRALAFIQAEHAGEMQARVAMLQSLEDGQLASGVEAKSIIDQAVVAWRAANRGKSLPKFDGAMTPAWKSLLDQMYMLAGEGRRQAEEVESLVRELGYEPLRLVLSGGAKLVVYAAPKQDERDDRLTPHIWVHRITLEHGKKSLKEQSRRWAVLPKLAASETTLHEWSESEEWIHEGEGRLTFERKQEILALPTGFESQLRPFIEPMSSTDHAQHLLDWRDVRKELLRHGRLVLNPVIAVPIGVIYYPRTKSLQYLCVGTSIAHAILHRQAPTEKIAADLRAYFTGSYENEIKAGEMFDSDLTDRDQWSLLEVGVKSMSSRQGVYLRQSGVEGRLDGRNFQDPRLSAWLECFLTSTKDYAKVWLAPGVMDDKGRCNLDTLMNFELPADFEPLDIQEIKLRACKEGQELPKYNAWFDISPHVEKPIRPLNDFMGDRPASVGEYGYSVITYFDTSRAAARSKIRKKVEGRTRVVPAADLIDAPQPPEGIERWFLVRVE